MLRFGAVQLDFEKQKYRQIAHLKLGKAQTTLLLLLAQVTHNALQVQLAWFAWVCLALTLLGLAAFPGHANGKLSF